MRCHNPFAFRPGPVTFWTTAIYLAVAIPLIFIHETVPPAPGDHSLYRGLNLTEAWADLEVISNAYHPYNSRQNDRVREFIVNRTVEILERNGVKYSDGMQQTDGAATSVALFDDQVSNVTWTYDTSGLLSASVGPAMWAGQYFEGNNFYVYLRGKDDPEGDWWTSQSRYKKTHREGGVLVNCHFDSVATGYGATDDGMACVSMLQMLSYFTSAGRQPKHGIVFLFNNAEEPGLLGARAFGNSPLLPFCHTFVNLEGAGAGGRAILFRTTDLEVAKAYSGAPHPFGSVVAANAFERGVIRSGTDFQIFTEYYGQRGMDIAFYEPRARYHTEEDDARHASVASIWHMLSAALASTETLSQQSATIFSGPRPDGKKDLVQNGRMTPGVWFDLFGDAWAAFALRGLFAWSLTLLVATPLVLLTATYVLARKDKYYYFARDVWIHSEDNDDPIVLGGWKGFFRFPLALIFAGGLTIASVFLLAKFNPFIVYSSGYAVWSMTISLFYFSFWLIMRGSSVIRPTALQRGFVNIWLFVIGWAMQVLAAVAEDRMNIAALYPAAFLQSAVFASLFISLMEQFALPGKREFATMLHDAHQTRDLANNRESRESEVSADTYEDAESEGEEEDEPTETTPLRAGEQDYGSNVQPTFANTYRRSVSRDGPAPPVMKRYAPYDSEQSWSGRLPSWTWLLQFLLLAPVPLILMGNLGLVAMSAMNMTGTDGGNLLTPIMAHGIMSIMLLLPLTPFMHRITHHVPLFLMLVFVGTFVYNLAAFPFSNSHRFKFYFQQVLDLDEETNIVTLTGVEEYVRDVIATAPVAAGQHIGCKPNNGRDLVDCRYDASALPPDLVPGKNAEDLINVTTSRADDGRTADVVIEALDTRTCYLHTSDPIFGFSVDGGSERDARFGSFPPEGLQTIQVWRRDWDRPWTVTLQLKEDRGKSVVDSIEAAEGEEGEEKALNVTVRCAYSDANKPSTIPAFHELRKYMPTWAVATKRTVGLVEVKKTYAV